MESYRVKAPSKSSSIATSPGQRRCAQCPPGLRTSLLTRTRELGTAAARPNPYPHLKRLRKPRPKSRGVGQCARVIPSPLNGEKVAEGRMRGGNAHGFGLIDSLSHHQSTSPPLTPALSPLRGEGESHRAAGCFSTAGHSSRRSKDVGMDQGRRRFGCAVRNTATLHVQHAFQLYREAKAETCLRTPN